MRRLAWSVPVLLGVFVGGLAVQYSSLSEEGIIFGRVIWISAAAVLLLHVLVEIAIAIEPRFGLAHEITVAMRTNTSNEIHDLYPGFYRRFRLARGQETFAHAFQASVVGRWMDLVNQSRLPVTVTGLEPYGESTIKDSPRLPITIPDGGSVRVRFGRENVVRGVRITYTREGDSPVTRVFVA